MKNGARKNERTYSRLTVEEKEREEIAIFLSLGISLSDIAGKLGRDKGTVSREIRRNNAQFRNVKCRARQARKRSEKEKAIRKSAWRTPG
jgi:IS30 family transposase